MKQQSVKYFIFILLIAVLVMLMVAIAIWHNTPLPTQKLSSEIYPLFSNLKWSTVSAQKIQNTNGYQITATDTINNNVDARNFFNYYDNKLRALGWGIDNNFAADGILGSQVGYKKENNYIILSYNIKPGKVTSKENEPLQWTCPCDVAYSIFTK